MSIKLPVEFVNPFLDATIEALHKQCGLLPAPGRPFLKEGGAGYDIAIAGIIGLTSDSFNGTLSLCFSHAVFLALMSGMLGETCGEINADLEDGAGELLNVIAGKASRVLKENGFIFTRSLPAVVRGNSLTINAVGSEAVASVILPFSTTAGPFFVQIAIERRPSGDNL